MLVQVSVLKRKGSFVFMESVRLCVCEDNPLFVYVFIGLGLGDVMVKVQTAVLCKKPFLPCPGFFFLSLDAWPCLSHILQLIGA